jgi:hypothetical protein
MFLPSFRFSIAGSPVKHFPAKWKRAGVLPSNWRFEHDYAVRRT